MGKQLALVFVLQSVQECSYPETLQHRNNNDFIVELDFMRVLLLIGIIDVGYQCLKCLSKATWVLGRGMESVYNDLWRAYVDRVNTTSVC